MISDKRIFSIALADTTSQKNDGEGGTSYEQYGLGL